MSTEKKETCGCSDPSIRARWTYDSHSSVEIRDGKRIEHPGAAFAYCRNCEATWKYSKESCKLVRVA